MCTGPLFLNNPCFTITHGNLNIKFHDILPVYKDFKDYLTSFILGNFKMDDAISHIVSYP